LNGKLDCLKYFGKNSSFGRSCCYAVSHDHFDCYNYLKDIKNCCKLCSIDYAIKTGDLSLVQKEFKLNFLHSRKYCEMAAKYGHIDVMVYLIGKGCAYDILKLYNIAKEFGNVACAKYAFENGVRDMFSFKGSKINYLMNFLDWNYIAK